MSKKILIVGSGGFGLMAAKIAELKEQNADMEVLTIEEAKESEFNQTFEITASPLVNDLHYFKQRPTRAERRKQERMKKKNK